LPVSRASQTADVSPNSQGSLQTIYHVTLILVDGIIYLKVETGSQCWIMICQIQTVFRTRCKLTPSFSRF
jgi:hypothetical protein